MYSNCIKWINECLVELDEDDPFYERLEEIQTEMMFDDNFEPEEVI